ncbi:nucleotide pyrophosphatase [Bifidobacterium aemilianum]|uniref:Nucleotide pyrophosphatase n=1 Tax=Bifidobacterium aemilianum TaxID=2493120 RepID=A0A366KC02_9BIFI|nr:alkaline phosphatase family protein [Bifidobacterium aemilianum]RBP98181.1 nucleotide pyrophosphatase [Bifidobacterium aemilianum]
MNLDLPSTQELLRLREPATYGDQDPMASPQPGQSGGGELLEGPRGGALHLSSLLPALTASLGHPVGTAVHRDPKALQEALGLPSASSAIVVLVDGLGYWNLKARLGHAPYLRSLMSQEVNQRPIASCAPTTTVAAMGTFGTGTCPGLTGMTGYTQRNPKTGKLSQLIQFRSALKPLDLQQQPTIFESLAGQEVRVTSSGLPKFADSPLTQAALRGSDYIGEMAPGQRARNAAQAARVPGLTYLYIRDADKNGHAYGWQSDQWIAALESIDSQLATLHRNAPAGCLIVITADHGMISTDPNQRIDIAEEEDLARGVALVGGEPRFTMLYAQPDVEADDIARRWREHLGTRARVMTRQEALELGLYGPVEERIIPMIGDVLVCAAEAVTIVDSRSQSAQATRLPSVHGSLTAAEQDIPCLIDLI